MRVLVAALVFAGMHLPVDVPLVAFAEAQQPRVANGRIEPHTVSAGLAKDLPTLARTLSEPAWIGYAVPVADRHLEMCDYGNDYRSRTLTDAPVQLEPAGLFFVFYRIENGQVARIRSYSANCPMDAGGKTLHWFTNVPVADSLGYLRSLIDASASTSRVVDSAVAAVAMHDGNPALDALVTMARTHASTKVRGSALFWLAQRAGEKAAGTIAAAIENDPETEVKKKAVFALSQLPKDEGVPLLIEQARLNRNPVVRKQAMFWLGQSKDPRALRFFEEILK